MEDSQEKLNVNERDEITSTISEWDEDFLRQNF
jgi:hypothetical protein